jgi:pyridoxamine 5'-phosphate oxidase
MGTPVTESSPPSAAQRPLTNDKPIALFEEWLREASQCGLREPTAMAMASCDREGRPSVRMLLLKGVDEKGFVFYTNLQSRKAEDLAANPHASLCFYWMPLGKQVRIEGSVEAVTEAEADAYFASRPRLSQLGAWASRQSKPMAGPLDLEKKVCIAASRFGLAKVPRPPFWSGYRLVPATIEFWKEKPFRRHERILYSSCGDGWTKTWLFP